MRYMAERNFIQVIGEIWQPGIGTCAMEYTLSSQDIENIGEFTRENVQDWLGKNAGDFQRIEDFYALIGEGEILWENEKSELIYNDCMFSEEE